MSTLAVNQPDALEFICTLIDISDMRLRLRASQDDWGSMEDLLNFKSEFLFLIGNIGALSVTGADGNLKSLDYPENNPYMLAAIDNLRELLRSGMERLKREFPAWIREKVEPQIEEILKDKKEKSREEIINEVNQQELLHEIAESGGIFATFN